MKHTNIIVGIAVAVGLAVGGYFFLGAGLMGGVSLKNPQTNAENTSAQNESGKKMAFSQFVAQGGSYRCTVNQYFGETATQGTTYINGGMIRGLYSTQAGGMNIDTTFIVRDGYSYTWTSVAPNMGFKSKVVTGVMNDGSTGTSGTYSFNAEQIGDYDCQEWTPDASMFVLPAGVTFTEVSN